MTTDGRDKGRGECNEVTVVRQTRRTDKYSGGVAVREHMATVPPGLPHARVRGQALGLPHPVAWRVAGGQRWAVAAPVGGMGNQPGVHVGDRPRVHGASTAPTFLLSVPVCLAMPPNIMPPPRACWHPMAGASHPPAPWTAPYLAPSHLRTLGAAASADAVNGGQPRRGVTAGRCPVVRATPCR